MNILVVSDYNDKTVGGVQSVVRSQVSALRQLGHTVTIVCPFDRLEANASDNIIYVPSFRFWRPGGYAAYNPIRTPIKKLEAVLLQAGSWDVVHIHTTGPLALQASRIARRHAIPIIQTMHGRDDVYVVHNIRFPTVWSIVLAWIEQTKVRYTVAASTMPGDTLVAKTLWNSMLNRAQRADVVLFPSQHFMNKFLQRGLKHPAARVLSNGIDDDRIVATERVYRPAMKQLRLIWCGRVSSEKNPRIAIDSVAESPDCSLDIYGTGPMLDTLADYITSRGITNVRLLGRYSVDEIIGIMRRYDMLLYTSYNFDNQPMVLLEAAAAGLPVLYCDPDMTECMPSGGGVLSSRPTARSLQLTRESLTQAELLDMHRSMIRGVPQYAQTSLAKKLIAIYTRAIHHAS